MNKKTSILFVLLFSVMALSACNQTQAPSEEMPNPELTQMETEVPAGKIAADATELSYKGSAQFITLTTSIPCADYALESDVCKNDPNGTVSTDRFYVQLPTEELNSELLSYLENQSDPLVTMKEDGNYLVDVGCKNDNQIKGDMYSYDSTLLNDAFENGSSHMVDFNLSLVQPERGDAGCLSLITEFNSIQ